MSHLTLGAIDPITLVIQQGDNVTVTVTVRDAADALVNLTGYTARLQVRERVDSTTTLTERTSVAGSITLGGAAGTVAIAWTAAETAAFDWRRGVFDLEIVSGAGVVRKILKGSVKVEPEVTR